jgi:hypothetical protein
MAVQRTTDIRLLEPGDSATDSRTRSRQADRCHGFVARTVPPALYGRARQRRRSSAVEQLIRNQQVLGSSPSVGTNKLLKSFIFSRWAVRWSSQ